MSLIYLQRKLAKQLIVDYSQPLLAINSSIGKYYVTGETGHLYAVISKGESEIYPAFSGAWIAFRDGLETNDSMVKILDDGIRKIEHLL